MMANTLAHHLAIDKTIEIISKRYAYNICREKWKNSFRVLQKRWKHGFPKLSPQQVTSILKANEKSFELAGKSSVRSFDSNFIPSNTPIEDRCAAARCLHTTGLMFGVFDGHNGFACAEIVSRRLLNYIAAALLPSNLLQEFASLLQANDGNTSVTENFSEGDYSLTEELNLLYAESFKKFVLETAKNSSMSSFKMREALMTAFQRLDQDMSNEALQKGNTEKVRGATLAVGCSGAVGCVAHIDGAYLHVANTGDCRSILGSIGDAGNWIARPLSREHSYENESEVKRILSEHPNSESGTLIRNGRLLGELAPLRALGDFRYKWSLDVQKEYLSSVFKNLPSSYYTPPYLTACPEVIEHRLSPRDKFLILASDGLWEQIEPLKAVRLVGEYMRGRQTLDPFHLPSTSAVTLGEIASTLEHRRERLNLKPVDANASTHLIRNVLGGTEHGVEHAALSRMLSYPADVVRFIRDDITVVIVFFDTDYIRKCPA